MPWGLLWHDGDPQKPLEEKVRQAAGRYFEKFGAKPTICFVSPDWKIAESITIDDYTVVSHHTVLKDHFWIGVA